MGCSPPGSSVHGISQGTHIVGFLGHQFSSVAQSCLTLCDPWTASPLCPSSTLEVYPNSCPLSRWCHPTISSSVVTSSSHLQSFPALGSFQRSQPFASGGQGIGVWLISFRMDWLDLLADQGTLKSLLQHHSLKASILRRLAFFIVQLSHPYMNTGKTIALTRWTFFGKVMSLFLICCLGWS